MEANENGGERTDPLAEGLEQAILLQLNNYFNSDHLIVNINSLLGNFITLLNSITCKRLISLHNSNPSL